MIICTGIGSCINIDRVRLRDLNNINSLNYFLNIQFIILWWLLRLNKLFLVNLEDGFY